MILKLKKLLSQKVLMSKDTKNPVKPVISFVMVRKDSGYQAVKLEIVDGKVIKETPCFEPDVLAIAIAKLTTEIRKDLGL